MLQEKTKNTSDAVLGTFLAFTAGTINASGFVAAGRYSSHMTGILSGTADALVLGEITLLLSGLASICAFIAGAIFSTVQINWARRANLHGENAWSLIVEALLLLLVGLFGTNFNQLTNLAIPISVIILCFIMGLQNAIIVRVSATEIRTTHMTGIVTDLGIELGRLLYWNRDKQRNSTLAVIADRRKLQARIQMLVSFLSGAVLGTLAFQQFDFQITLPFALVLLLLATKPIYLDYKHKYLVIEKSTHA